MEAINTNAVVTLAESLVEAIREGQLDAAEQMFQELVALQPDMKDYLVFPVMIAIQRGFVVEALQYLNTLDDDQCPELKALCLNIMGDPTWHAYAAAGLDSSDKYVRKAMRELCGMEPEPDDVAASTVLPAASLDAHHIRV